MKPTILFVDNDPGYSGPTVSMNYLIDSFIENNYEIGLVTNKSKSLIVEYERKNVKIYSLSTNLHLNLHFTNQYSFFTVKGCYFFLQMLFRLMKGTLIAYSVIRKAKPDLVYINEYVLLQFAIAAKLQKIPSFTHIRSQFLKGTFGLRKKWLSSVLLKCNEKIFAITPQEANQIIVKSINKKNKITIVPEFLNDENFKIDYPVSEIKKNIGIAESKIIILMLGGIEKVKGTYEVIEAIGLLKNELPSIFLVIAGNFHKHPSNLKYWERCQKFIELNNLKDHIKILPPIQNANHLIAIADIVVSSSIMSHFSRPVIEAWAKMKPVIAAKSIHSIEYIEDGANGLLYDPASPKELKEKIKMILENSALRLRISENGYKKAQTIYIGRINTKIIIDEVNKILHK